MPLALEVIGFADEEGARFGVTLLGSRGLTGQWPQEWLAQTDADGVSIAQAMRDFGLDPAAIAQARRAPNEIRAYLELHIEQGRAGGGRFGAGRGDGDQWRAPAYLHFQR